MGFVRAPVKQVGEWDLDVVSLPGHLDHFTGLPR
jgi:hypothetical protein